MARGKRVQGVVCVVCVCVYVWGVRIGARGGEGAAGKGGHRGRRASQPPEHAQGFVGEGSPATASKILHVS